MYSHETKKGPSSQGVKKGKYYVNLSDYIGKGLKTECFKMDMDKNQHLWLTVRIAVIELDSSKDITTISMLAT